MPIFIPKNSRERGSRLTDTRMLRPGDELQVFGRKFVAFMAVLDAHDPSAEVRPTIRQTLGIEQPSLPNHHHVLVQVEDESDILSTGLYVGTGRAEELIFPHITRLQMQDDTYVPRLRRLDTLVQAGIDGLYYVSNKERLSATSEGRPYLDNDGGLLR